jgi:hypothetical protein
MNGAKLDVSNKMREGIQDESPSRMNGLQSSWRTNSQRRRSTMTLCPIALVAGCKKCPAFSVCPLKSLIGDYRKAEETQTTQKADNENK